MSDVMEAMDMFPEAVFIDAGSNIGVYTLAVAAMLRSVVAVDMMQDNLAFIRESLTRRNLQGFVRLFNNALSDTKEVLWIPLDDFENKFNPGGRTLSKDKVTDSAEQVAAVLLSDVLDYAVASTFILKLDIQGFDCKVHVVFKHFINHTDLFQVLKSNDVFGQFYIPFIFIEWMSTDKSCIDLVPHLLYLGYTPYW